MTPGGIEMWVPSPVRGEGAEQMLSFVWVLRSLAAMAKLVHIPRQERGICAVKSPLWQQFRDY